MKSYRLLGCLGLFVGAALLASLFAWMLLRFTMPTPTRFDAGPVSEYLPGQAPRLFFEQSNPVYVLNSGGEIIALEARSKTHVVRCIVRWQADLGVFVDPCLGTHLSTIGAYLGAGPPSELRRFPVLVKDGEIWVDLGYQ